VPIVRRLIGIVVVLLLVVVVALVGLVGSITGRALPQTAGTVRAAGLTAPATVIRDVNGIAQIVADNPHDLFLAQGYVHAQDRFWQMEVWRHIGAGRLSELFGESTLDKDRFIRTLGWRAAAQRDLDAASPELLAVLQAYADGVNAWLATNHDRLGLAFVVTGAKSGLGGGLAGYDPEPWTPLDSATWAKVQAWNLGGNFDSEIFRLLADAQLGDPTRTDQLFPAYASDAPVIVPTGLPGSGGAGASGPAGSVGSVGSVGIRTAGPGEGTTFSAAALAGLRSIATIGGEVSRIAGLDAGGGLASSHGIGSNDWVVGASKSATGRALLANDPHLGISMPSVWYMNGLHCRVVDDACPYDAAGVSFPGAPLVILGHNARIAWGATNIGPDVQDLFVEKADPADPTHYLFRDQSLPFTVRAETIKVAGGDPVTIQVRETGHGPILNDVSDSLRDLPDLYALRWTATAEPDHALEAFLGLDTARGYDDFRAALRKFGAPAQNFVYADVGGHIGYQAPGWIPIRADPNDRGDRPVPGWDGKHEWVGRIAFDDLPRVYDPPSGFIVTANNALVDEQYPYYVASEWDPGYRARRILDRLGAAATDGGGVTVAEMSTIQADTKVLRAARIVPSLDARVVPATADGRTVLDRIRAWDGMCDVSSEGCAAYLAFEEQTLRGLFDDDLGSVARDYVGSDASWQSLIALLATPHDRFWDDARTADRVESAPDVLAAALDGAGRELRSALGSERHWTWGRLHTATFREATLGESGIGPLEWYFDSGPHQVPGAAGAVNNTYYRFDRAYPDPGDPSYLPVGLRGTFEMTNMPSYRLDLDMGDLDGARIVQTTGQSGNPFDRHYGDLIGAWVEGRQVPLPFSADAVGRSAAAVLTLTP
jgi:penicillin amidase